MFRIQETFIFFFLLSTVARADSDSGIKEAPSEGDARTSNFPSISSISSSDGFFSIPQPSLDLAPTDLAENSPMSFSIPSLELNLDETDFAKNAPMSFNITQPEFDLQPSFTFKDLEEAPEPETNVDEVESSSDNKLPLETQIYPKEGGKDENRRRRRQVPEFPSIFSFRSSNDPFSIAFPSPDLTPG